MKKKINIKINTKINMKINIAQLLKDCPRGMELDCTMFENLEFDRTEEDYIICRVKTKIGYNIHTFTKYGCFSSNNYAKCVIFPKGKTTWEGFHRPFVEGDIVSTENGVYIGIVKSTEDNHNYYTFCSIDDNRNFYVNNYTLLFNRFATKEEKERLFQAIKENGYKWNAKTKTLERLLEFNDGDVVVAEDNESFQLFLLKHLTYYENANSYYGDCYFGWDFRDDKDDKLFEKGNWGFNRLATKEEKQKLFDTIKANGYKWNAETEILEKLPTFKVGNRIKSKISQYVYIITDIREDIYIAHREAEKFGYHIPICTEKNYELFLDKFDITTLKLFESRVLVRNYDNQIWMPTFWGGEYFEEDFNCRYLTTNGCYKYCIPYEGNEHLCGKVYDCDVFYKTWEK